MPDTSILYTSLVAIGTGIGSGIGSYFVGVKKGEKNSTNGNNGNGTPKGSKYQTRELCDERSRRILDEIKGLKEQQSKVLDLLMHK